MRRPHRPAQQALARITGIAPQDETNAQASATFIQWFRNLNASLDIPEKLAGIQEEHIPLMARRAASESNPLYPVPRLMTREELEGFYDRVCAEGASATI